MAGCSKNIWGVARARTQCESLRSSGSRGSRGIQNLKRSRSITTDTHVRRPPPSVWLPWTLACAGVSTSLALLWSSRRRVEAEQPSQAAQQIQQSEASTLPLQAVGLLRYDLSEQNLQAAYRDFVGLLGEGNVDLRKGELISRSSTAWSPAPNGEADIPSMIVFPRDTQDVSNIARICHARRIPMIGFSGGTSLEGTLAAQHNEVCVDFNRHMNKVLEVRKDDMDITVQPAVGYQQMNKTLEDQGLFFPVDPGPGAQFGGMIAQGCSGTNAYRYGTMKDWVLGLEIVLADGTIIKTRGRARKSSSGYDLTRLFTGSEGTLGFITKAHIRVARIPQNVRVAVAQFPTVADAVRMAVRVLQSGHQLEAMELLDELTMHGVNEGGYCSTQWAVKPTLFMKLANPSADVVEQTGRLVENFAKDCGSTLFRLAKDEEEGDEIWYARKTALWSLLALKKDPNDEFISSDPCVPIANLAAIVSRSQELLEESGMSGSILGHIGDGRSLLRFSALFA